MTANSGVMHALVVEPGPPQPEKDAGSRAIVDFVDGLTALGYRASLAVESNPKQLERAVASKPDLVVLSRPGTFLRNAERFERAECQLLYFPHDLHSERLRTGAQISSQFSSRAAAALEILERKCITAADNSLFPTESEAILARKLCPGARASAINYYWFNKPGTHYRDRPGCRVVFVGSRDHAPNSDGVMWFLTDMWPQILSELPEAELALVGDWQDVLDATGSKRVSVHKGLGDESLDRLLQSCHVAIAPLRFGAGMKRKTVHYLSQGLPVVSTSFGAQGLEGSLADFPAAVISDDAPGFTQSVIDLMSSPSAAEKMSDQAGKLTAQHFSFDRYLEKLTSALAPTEL
jgi:glycosyltransferase involved in cell wall biosynthesis